MATSTVSTERPKPPGRSRLVITRGDDEAVHIGDDVTVRVRMVRGKARLTIDAPRHITILRDELEMHV